MKDEWLLYRIRKAKAELELDEWECPKESRRNPSEFKVFLTPRDEEEIRREERKERSARDHLAYMKKVKKLKEGLSWENMWK